MNSATGADRSYVLTLGFATAVSMWAVAYVCRLPVVMAPAWLLLGLMLVAVVLWGREAGRATADGWRAGLFVGATAGVLNLLILGSLLSSDAAVGLVPSALWWIPGSLLVVGGLAAASAAVAAAAGPEVSKPERWTALLCKVSVAATFLLVVAGGLVTSNEAGLAVVDWPNSFGYNMFLYPLSRMTGGIYYEHAHRLFGSLVGLATIVLAVRLWRCDERIMVRRLALLALVTVVIQGILGGLRVTGHFTFSQTAEEMNPNIWLAIAHGVLGQVFLGLVVGLAAGCSVGWRGNAPPSESRTVHSDRSLHLALVGTLVLQLVLGAVQRHLAQGLVIHVSLAAVVAMIAVIAGARAWGLYRGVWPVQRLGQLLMATVCVQVTLGIAALAVTQGRAIVGHPTTLEVTLATAHQACGAALLALSVVLLLWMRRLYTPVEDDSR